jgi:multidrug efflux system outer membrane protein
MMPRRSLCPPTALAAARANALALALLATLPGCVSMAPSYHRPAPAVPQTWPVGPAYALPADVGRDDAAQLGWRQYFADPRLQTLIELTLANNLDLRVAVLNIEKAQAQYRIERAAFFPVIDAAGSVTQERVPAALSPTLTPESLRALRSIGRLQLL